MSVRTTEIENVVVQIDAEIIGALLGAIVGAVSGAMAGLGVSMWSICQDRQVAACSAMQALAAEARGNAHVVRHMPEEMLAYSPFALERQAFDAALPVLHVQPAPLRDRSRDARAKVIILMHLDELLEMSLIKADAPPSSIVQKRQGLLETISDELDGLADDIKTFVKTDCESRWFRSRAASAH